jgi:uncharacterized protein YjdB
MANMLTIATFALMIASCEDEENTASDTEKINSISVEPRSLYLEVDSTKVLTVTLSPDDALTDPISWSSYNKGIATVSVTGARTAVIRGVSIGTTNITIVTSNNKRAVCEVTVSKTVPLVAITVTPGDSLHLEPGDTKTLVATQGPANATNYHPVWTSSNTEVVTVENGTVKAVASGSATVTVTSGNISKSLYVLVTSPLYDIILTPGELNIPEIGLTHQLSATPVPANAKDYNPVWLSNNSGIVTVSQTGLLTAVGVGTTYVTVYCGDPDSDSYVSTYLNVTVTSAYLRDIHIANTDLGIPVGGTLQIEASPLPETADYTPTWSSSDENVATVSQDGLVTGIAGGEATITISSGDVQKLVTISVGWSKYSPVAEGWTATSKGEHHDWRDTNPVEDHGNPRFVLDGDRTTGWHSATGNPFPQCLVVDMKESKAVDRIVIWHLPDALSQNWLYYNTIQVYVNDSYSTPNDDPASWGSPASTYTYAGGYDPVTIDLNQGSQGQYLILLFPDYSGNPYTSFTELDVYRKIY